MTTTAITLRVDRVVVATAPRLRRAGHLPPRSVGWLRKHVGWKEDAKSDEAPGCGPRRNGQTASGRAPAQSVAALAGRIPATRAPDLGPAEVGLRMGRGMSDVS